jgi:hypothetical protein
MKDVSAKMALAKKAIAEMGRIEDALLRGKVTEEDFKLAKSEMQEFANIVAAQATAAVGTLMRMRGKVRKYKRELQSAIG